jgi:hypothetical protein
MNHPNAPHYAYPENGHVVVDRMKAGEEHRLLRVRIVVGIDLVEGDIDLGDRNLGFDQIVDIVLAVRSGRILNGWVGLEVGIVDEIGGEVCRMYLGVEFRQRGAGLGEENRHSRLVVDAGARRRTEAVDLHVMIEQRVLASMSAGHPGVEAESVVIGEERCMKCVMFRWVDKKLVVLIQNILLDYLRAENIHIRCFHHVAVVFMKSAYIRNKTELQHT